MPEGRLILSVSPINLRGFRIMAETSEYGKKNLHPGECLVSEKTGLSCSIAQRHSLWRTLTSQDNANTHDHHNGWARLLELFEEKRQLPGALIVTALTSCSSHSAWWIFLSAKLRPEVPVEWQRRIIIAFLRSPCTAKIPKHYNPEWQDWTHISQLQWHESRSSHSSGL